MTRTRTFLTIIATFMLFVSFPGLASAGKVVEKAAEGVGKATGEAEKATGEAEKAAGEAEKVVGETGKLYEAKWESLNSRPTPQWWTDAKFGIFIHWGPYAVPAWSAPKQYSEWYWYRISRKGSKNPWWEFHKKNYGKDFTYDQFIPMFKAELFNPDDWAQAFADSGAKYIVLTSKHHDGFCLWGNETANKTWDRKWNSVDAGPKRDICSELGEAVRKKGIKMGYYYSLYEWFNPLWKTDRKRYVNEHFIPQFKDFVNQCKPAVIFTDGEWDLPSSAWKSEELLAWLFNESECKDEVVINDRWGKGERHKNGGYWTTEYGAGLPNADHPWEESRGMAYSYGYSRSEKLEDYHSGEEFVWMLIDLVSRGGNFLLDIGPTGDGRIPVIMVERLKQIGDWLKVNGEAIYGTKTYEKSCQWSEGEVPKQKYGEYKVEYDVAQLVGTSPVDGKAKKQAFFTTKPNTLYAILPVWPGETFTLKGIKPTQGTKITMLGVSGDLSYRVEGDNTVVIMPKLDISNLPCEYAWTLKITNPAK